VWCPSSSSQDTQIPGVTLHRTLGKMSIHDLRRVGMRLNQFAGPRRLLVQWVPHGYGYRSMNLLFCLWLWNRARRMHDEVEIMVHEPFLGFKGGTWRQAVAAAIHRIMAIILLNGASRIWIAIPAWRDRLRPYMLGRRIPIQWLPVPSNVECLLNVSKKVEGFRSDHSDTLQTLGHFGTFGWPISGMLEPLIPELLRGYSNRSLIFMGRGSTEFRLKIIRHNPDLAAQISATGEIDASELSYWIRKCTVMIQPYPDGVSSRRGTAMAALSHGLPMVTTAGPLTEDVWAESGAAALVPPWDVSLFRDAVDDLISDEPKRNHMGLQARRLYLDRFDVRHTIRALRSSHQSNLAVCES
jgi:glycosyltransferase involved in cell wall biosynthesis